MDWMSVAGIMGVKKFKVDPQTAVLDEKSGKYYLTTNVPKAEWTPFAYRDSSRVGWNNNYIFEENVQNDTWRIYFNNTPSGEFGGCLYCVSK